MGINFPVTFYILVFIRLHVVKNIVCLYISNWSIQRNLSEILLNQHEIRFYLSFSDWYETKRPSVWFQINRKMVNTIWFRVYLIRFRKCLSVCSLIYGHINENIFTKNNDHDESCKFLIVLSLLFYNKTGKNETVEKKYFEVFQPAFTSKLLDER